MEIQALLQGCKFLSFLIELLKNCLIFRYNALRPFRIQWQPLSVKTSLVAYQGRPGRFTTSTAASTEDKNEATTEEHVEESSDPKVTAMIVRHQTDYPYGMYTIVTIDLSY